MKNAKREHLVHLTSGDTLDLCASNWICREKIGNEFRFVNEVDGPSKRVITTSELLESLACGEVTITYVDASGSGLITYDEFIARLVRAYVRHSTEHGKPPAASLALLLASWSDEAQALRVSNKTRRSHYTYPTPSPRAFLARLRRLSSGQSRSS